MAIAGRYVDRQLILRQGRQCSWQQAVLCPCQQYDGAQGPPCTACERGYLYGTAKTIRALMTSDDRGENYDLAGAWEQGTAYATIRADLEIGDQDKLLVENFPIRDSLIQTRALVGAKDTLRQSHLVSLLVVRDDAVIYTPKTDYQLSEDAAGNPAIEWLPSGVAPIGGAKYSILCTIKMLWIVQDHAFIRGFGSRKKAQLPKRVRLHRYDRAVEGAS